MAQDVAGLDHDGAAVERWATVEAPARRRRWHTNGKGTFAVLIASSSDLDDLIPTLVAYQIEWNKLHGIVASALGRAPVDGADVEWCATTFGGTADDWGRVAEAWDGDLSAFLAEVSHHDLDVRVQMVGGSEIGYARVARRWWEPVTDYLRSRDLLQRPIYLVSSNTHSIANLLTGTARLPEAAIVTWLESDGPPYLRAELIKLREGRTRGSWANFFYYCARLFYQAHPDTSAWGGERREREQALGITHIPSRTALRVAAQVMELNRLDPASLDTRLRDVDADRLRHSDALIVNIDYPLGLGAYKCCARSASPRTSCAECMCWARRRPSTPQSAT